jgi:hypothetical protein
MTVFVPVRRATLLIPSGPAHDHARKHLFIILTDPVINPENQQPSVLLTSLSTLDLSLPHDPTCILQPGDHPFITRDSYVSYRSSQIREEAKLINGVQSGVFVAKDLMDFAIIEKICAGLDVSRQTPIKANRFYRTYLRALSGE